MDFKNFKDIPVSTKTYTAHTNLNINIDKLFEALPVTPYVVIPKKRGRKKKCDTPDPNIDIREGSIVTIKYEKEIRGVELKPKKVKQGKKTKWFRNSVTIVIILDKPINFKVCHNGTFQMTGCKKHEHAELCIKYIWKYIKDNTELYEIKRGENFEVMFIPSMRNIDFSLNFNVDREKLNNYMWSQEDFHCLLETSFGYTGVIIKFPLQKCISEMKIIKLSNIDNEWIYENTLYDKYLDLLSSEEKQNKLKAERQISFLVFHSGKVIMSGLTAEFMEDIYYLFTDIIKKAYPQIVEKLE